MGRAPCAPARRCRGPSWSSTAASPGSPWNRRCATPTAPPVGATVALASLERELAAYRQIQNVLLGAGLVSVLLAPFLSFAFARRALRAGAPAGRRRRGGPAGELRPADRLRPHRRGRAARPHLPRAAGRPAREARHGGVRHRAVPQPPGAARRPACCWARRRAGTCCCSASSCAATPAAGGGADPRQTLAELAADLERVTTAIARGRGQVEVIAGHRVLGPFRGGEPGAPGAGGRGAILEGSLRPISPRPDRSGRRHRRRVEAPVVALAVRPGDHRTGHLGRAGGAGAGGACRCSSSRACCARRRRARSCCRARCTTS